MNRHAGALLEALETVPRQPDHAWRRLRMILERHADSEFGRTHDFASIRSPEDFRSAIPPLEYEDHRTWIERAAAGEKRVLACDEPVGFELTSGTSAQAKWIPITACLREEYSRGLAAWFAGWKTRCPRVFDGQAYWAISPPARISQTTPGGMPVGMTGDAAYFPEHIGERLAAWLVIPELSGTPEVIFDETAAALLAAKDLSLVSVWSPTFLLGIDAALRRMRGDITWREQWPKLALVSCWADAASAHWIPRLRDRLGGIPIEPKGLLATEGITSVPDSADGSPRLAGECHWHEFLDESGCFTHASDVRPGAVYEVLLTTAGGLFRYRSGDRVRVTTPGSDGIPRLRFIGRAGTVSDLVGEKLHEDQAMEALGGNGFLVMDSSRPGYDLWLEDVSLAAVMCMNLRRNPYLDQALSLGQLAPFRVRRLPNDWCPRLGCFLAKKRGCRIGDVKPPVLLTNETPEEVMSWLD